MRLKNLEIRNFKAINFLKVEDLASAVVIAGQNGCGKSTILDALRLLKSACGQYYQNEMQNWYSEFQINLGSLREDQHKILSDPEKPLLVAGGFEFSESEIEYISTNMDQLVRDTLWRDYLAKNPDRGPVSGRRLAERQSEHDVLEARLTEITSELKKELSLEVHDAMVTLEPGGLPDSRATLLLQLAFSNYVPDEIGVMEYHSPSRTYTRENFGNLNLRVQDNANQKAQHALYNTANKYTGVKQELAQSFVTEAIAKEAGATLTEGSSLTSTLKELFESFFPGKSFLGAIPSTNGSLEFPIRLSSGKEHDLDDLSSGEKEVLLGYLRLRNSAPKNSMILMDEPELHLNPRLAKGLPRFYEKHLSKALNNQIWLVTHSDAILREAVSDPAYQVFHMQPSNGDPEQPNQLEPINLGEEIERAIVDLVGDLAAYNPRSKVVMIEGENAEFDSAVIGKLFSEFANRVNLVSLGSKKAVRGAHKTLEKAAAEGRLDARFYSIVDRDSGSSEIADSENSFSWNVYHIENYLLHTPSITQVMNDLSTGDTGWDEAKVDELLKSAAEATTNKRVNMELRERLNRILIGALDLGFDEQNQSSADGFSDSVGRSLARLNSLSKTELAKEQISELDNQIRRELEEALATGEWHKEFRGRDVLKEFVRLSDTKVSYEIARNLIVAKMKEAGVEPSGMKEVIETILGGQS